MVKYVIIQLKIPRMTRKVPAKTTKVLSGYCVVVAENNEGKIKLFGAPADHPSLEMGDEILEVNGKKLEDVSHDDVINHIHESIKSRRVSLKVRRRKGRRLVDEFPTYSIQNAYIVSSDDEARENFDRLHKNDAVTPVDMTNVLVDGKPEDLTIPNAKLDAGISVVQPSAAPLEPVPESDSHPSPTQEHQVVPETVFPDIPEPPRSKEDLLQRTLRNIETCIQLSRKQEGVRFSITPDEEEFPVRVLPEVKLEAVSRTVPDHCVPTLANLLDTHRCTNSAIETTLGASPVEEMAAQIQFSNHREMAIDVPESFVGSIKRPPRYPSSNKDHPAEPALPHPSPAIQDAERIKSYQADVRKRNEEEQSRVRKDEFLRNSLRESKKLQALEKNAKPPPPPGFLNPAFEEEMHAHGQTAVHDLAATFSVPDAQSMKQALDHISSALRRENGEFAEELNFLHALFDTPEFQNAADLHHLLESRQIGLSEPVTLNSETAETLMETVRRILPGCSNQEAQELQAILSTPQFENLLLTHDKLAAYRDELAQVQPQSYGESSALNGNFCTSVEGDCSGFSSGDVVTGPLGENGHGVEPPSSTSPSQSNYVGVDMRVVKIEKHGGDPLGATIKIDPQTGGVMVARIVHGGAAQKSGLLHENDELLDVNGFDLRGKSLDEVCEMLGKMTGTLTFVIIPAQAAMADIQPKREYIMHVKAHFDFNPDDDTYPEEVRCPCTDLGLAFRKGDILHVRNHDDRNWWQAYREGEEVGSTLAGLIPSRDFQQQREDHRLRKMGDGVFMNGGKGTGKRHNGSKQSGIKKPKAKKRKKVVAGSPLDVDVGEIPWYEEVGVYYPKQNQKRPIILIGPHHVGRQELRERLMATDIERFAPVTPHTTRPRREGDVNGYTYFFVTRHQFEEDIARGRFVEHGEFEKHLYGTSFDAIRDVALKGKICILNLQPQSLRLLRASDLKPYVVFIAPPSLDKLRINRQKLGAYPKDDELKAIIEDAREMEDTYGHFFDLVIVNTDFDKAFAELLDEINRLEREPQWVPVEWLR